MRDLILRTEEEWIREYAPIEDSENNEVKRFETYGEDLAFVRVQDPLKIWTLVEYEDDFVITNGYHLANRLGYYITEEPFDPKLDIEVPL